MQPSTFDELWASQHTWLITGAAGFIGSHLASYLLTRGQTVVGLDNFSTGWQHNLADVRQCVGEEHWTRFHFIEGDIRDRSICRNAAKGVDYVLHQAALGSVPRSIADPMATHESNVTGFLNMLIEARDANVRAFVYAASSSAYGTDASPFKLEDRIGSPLAPYAVSKLANELYADVFRRCYDFPAIGLRYFNVFGPRQDPQGAYAAVIPRWTTAMIHGDPVTINGDGETSRDFCYVANVVQANIQAAVASSHAATAVYNVAVGQQTSLKQLFAAIRDGLSLHQIHYLNDPRFSEFRAGDVRHSLADISKARHWLGYNPAYTIDKGLRETIQWYVTQSRAQSTPAASPRVA